MKYIYIYRMTSDTGSAPCIFENGYKDNKRDLLTLACCKGGKIYHNKDENTGKKHELSDEHPGKDVKAGLRHTIGVKHLDKNGQIKENEEIYVAGIYQDCILYVAKITKILRMEEYFSNPDYKNRLDYIYYPNTHKRNKNNRYFHPKEDIFQHRRDWNGEYVLMSDCFSYNGKNYSDYGAKDIEIYLPQNRETKVYDDNSEGVNEVFGVIKECLKDEKRCGPVTPIKDKCKGCYQK